MTELTMSIVWLVAFWFIWEIRADVAAIRARLEGETEEEK